MVFEDSTISGYPGHWRVERLSSVISVMESGSREQVEVSTDEGVPNLGGEHIGSNNMLLLKNLRFVTMSYYNSMRSGVVKENDILLVKDGATIGRVALVRELPFERCSINEHIFLIRPTPVILPEFLFYNLCSGSIQKKIWSLVTGAAQPGLNASFIKSLEILVPPLEEQIIITRFLNHEISRIDQLVTNNLVLIELLQEKRIALISNTVTKGLHTGGGGDLKDSGVEWLGSIPEHWKVVRLKFKAPSRRKKVVIAEPIRYIGLENIESWTGKILNSGQTKFIYQLTENLNQFDHNDVLFGKLRPYLAKIICPDFKGVCTNDVIVLCPTSDFLRKYLMYNMLNRSYISWITSFAYGTKMPRVSPEQVGNSLIPMTTITEQQAIVDFLDRETDEMFTVIEKVHKTIGFLLEYRYALVSMAVRGQIDVREFASLVVKC